MPKSTHRIRAVEVRRVTHPVFPTIEKFWLTVAAKEFPFGISTSANARDPVGLNRRVYREVRHSLDGQTATRGTFDLMNKGITILADSVKMVDKDSRLFELTIDDEEGGIVDGAHTAKIIEEANREGTVPAEQHVEVFVRTAIPSDLVSDIARGLNTGIQVASQSIYNIEGVFDWLKDEVGKTSYAGLISWNESDDKEYDVRDLISVLELFNVFDYPNDVSMTRHPISAYEKWSKPLEKFAADVRANLKSKQKSTYYRLMPLLRNAMELYDHIRRDFREMRNEAGGSAGKMNIIEEASERRKAFDFPFAALPSAKYRLTKGAAFPILAAFRTYVEVDPKTGFARWRGGFAKVLKAWREAGPTLVEDTYLMTRDGKRNPDALGKDRKHWANLHMRMQVMLLQERLVESESGKAHSKRR